MGAGGRAGAGGRWRALVAVGARSAWAAGDGERQRLLLLLPRARTALQPACPAPQNSEQARKAGAHLQEVLLAVPELLRQVARLAGAGCLGCRAQGAGRGAA